MVQPPRAEPRRRDRSARPRRPRRRYPARRERLRRPVPPRRRRTARRRRRDRPHPQRRPTRLLRRLPPAHRPLAARHIDFLSKGGYVLIPPSQIAGKPYRHAKALEGDDELDWHGRPDSWNRRRAPQARRTPSSSGDQPPAAGSHAQREGNRNAGLYWAANRALEADQAADLSPLAAAARQAGLDQPEITRTLNSARRTSQARIEPPDRQAEGEQLT